MLERLNKFLYIPRTDVLLVNLVLFALLFILVIYGSFSTTIGGIVDPISKTDRSFGVSALLLGLGMLASFASIYGRTRKYFICPHQSLRASLGTTFLVTLLYAIIWSLVQMSKGTQHFVLLTPSSWSLQVTFNNLKFGSIIFLFSAISLVGSLAVISESGYDFSTFVNQWRPWKKSVKKLMKGSRITLDDHQTVLSATEKMMTTLDSIAGSVQPVSAASAQALKQPLKEFNKWYREKTAATFADFDRFDETIAPQTERILRLC